MNWTLFTEKMLDWYRQSARVLPWRENRDPYRIWISEIMLQQTRVDTVIPYYKRFMETFPCVEALAKADEETLLKHWEGLGYYTRARNLRKAANVIMETYRGVFPTHREEIRKLPGIGDYTAGAICSIAFDQPTPAVDGNVLRVISRITDDATPIDLPAYKKTVRSALGEIYPAQAGDFTQALMELGATICGPNRLPDCENCPCRAFCLGNLRKTAENLPVKSPKRERRTEEYTVFVLSCGGRIALEKRPGKGLLAGLWQLPNVPGKLDVQTALERVEKFRLKPKEILMQVEEKHIFTHIEWRMRGVYVNVAECAGDFVWMDETEILRQAALPTAFRRFLLPPKEKI